MTQPLSGRVQRLLTVSVPYQPPPWPDPERSRRINNHGVDRLVGLKSQRKRLPYSAGCAIGRFDVFTQTVATGCEQSSLAVFFDTMNRVVTHFIVRTEPHDGVVGNLDEVIPHADPKTSATIGKRRHICERGLVDDQIEFGDVALVDDTAIKPSVGSAPQPAPRIKEHCVDAVGRLRIADRIT